MTSQPPDLDSIFKELGKSILTVTNKITDITSRVRTLETRATSPVSSLGGLTAVLEGPGIDVVFPATVGLGGDTILRYDADLTPVAEFIVSNLDAALASCDAGDILVLPAGSISGNHTIPAAVGVVGMSRLRTILTGVITMSSGSIVSNLTNHETDADALCFLRGAGGQAYVINCDCIATGTFGAAVGKCTDANNLHFWYCYLSATINGVAVDPLSI